MLGASIQIEESEQVLKLINDALIDSRKGKDFSNQAIDFVSAIKLLTKIGKIEEREKLSTELIEIAPKVELPTGQFVLPMITEVLIDMGKIDEAFDYWRRHINPDIYQPTFIKIADAFVKNVPIDKIIRNVEKNDYPQGIARTYAVFAESYIGIGKIIESNTMLSQAYISLQNITQEFEKSRTLAELAKAEAKLGSFLKARQNTEQCLQSDKLYSYVTIMREYHIKKYPSLAKVFEEFDQETNLTNLIEENQK